MTFTADNRSFRHIALVALAVLFGVQAVTVRSQQAKAQTDPKQLPPPKPVAGQTPPIAPNVTETSVPPRVALPPGPAVTADVPNRPLTADESVRIALRYQPNVTAARAAITAAVGRTQQARSGLLPTVSATAGYSHLETLSGNGNASVSGSGSNTGTGGTGGGTGSGGTGSGGPNTGGTGSGTTTGTSNAVGSSVVSSGYQASLVLRQLLFDFNHTRDLVREASLQERAAAENLARVQSDLVLMVKQAFYQYVQSSELVTIDEQNVANRQSQLALARARLNSGLGLPSDVVSAESALASATTDLITQRNNQLVARINLALVMGVDPRTPIIAAPSAESRVSTDDVQSLVNSGLQQRPEILQAIALLNSAKYGVNAAKTTNAPSIGGNIALQSRGDNFPPSNDSLSVGVSVQWTPFDGGLTAGRVKEARANVESLQAQLTGTQLTVVSDVSQAYVNLRSAEQRVVTSSAEVANAQEGVRIAEGRFGRGLGLFLDILNAQQNLVTARTNLAAAKYGVDQARAALARAIGAPLPR